MPLRELLHFAPPTLRNRPSSQAASRVMQQHSKLNGDTSPALAALRARQWRSAAMIDHPSFRSRTVRSPF